jgi:hypothetical protein
MHKVRTPWPAATRVQYIVAFQGCCRRWPGLSVSRFCAVAEVPYSTFARWGAHHRDRSWPAPRAARRRRRQGASPSGTARSGERPTSASKRWPSAREVAPRGSTLCTAGLIRCSRRPILDRGSLHDVRRTVGVLNETLSSSAPLPRWTALALLDMAHNPCRLSPRLSALRKRTPGRPSKRLPSPRYKERNESCTHYP